MVKKGEKYDFKMSTPAPDSNESPNPMDELRHVQLLLKREDIFTDFQCHEIQELNRNLRQESQKVLSLQKFLLYLHMVSIGDRAVSLPPKYFDSLFKEISEKSATQTATAQINSFYNVLSSFVNSLPTLARCANEVVKTKAELVDQMTFSTIPGLFGYLWNAESSEQFLQFLKEIVTNYLDIAPLFVRVIFALPQFRQFFDSVVNGESNLSCMVENVVDEPTAQQFCKDFLKKWKESAQFCPNIVKECLMSAPDPGKLLLDSFFIPAFSSPRTFGIISLSLRIGPESFSLITKGLENISGELWDTLKNVESPSTLPSSAKLINILPDLNKSASFTSKDIEVLTALVECPGSNLQLAQIDNSFVQDEYATYVFILPTIQEVPRPQSGNQPDSLEDEIEKQLREMLTGVDVIPLAAQSSTPLDMVRLLKSQVQLARPDHRLLLEMKIDDFQSAKHKLDKQWEFQDFLTLLRTKFEERQPQRLEKLEKISLYNTEYSQMQQLSKSLKKSIDTYRDILRFHLVEKWLNETHPLSEISDNLCLGDSTHSPFVDFYKNISAQLNQWCTSHQYTLTMNQVILHNIVMREIPQEKFLQMHPDLVKKDSLCYNGIHTQKAELLRQNTFDFTSTFQENPKLLESAQNQLQQAFDAPLPLDKLQYFGDALNTLVFVLTFEGHKEVGADQWLPMTILLLVLAEPKRLPSTIAYIDHFVKNLAEQGSDIHLISETTEYTFTMIKSALMHFQKSIPGIGDSQES